MRNTLQQRIWNISKKYDLSHLGSNLTAVEIIDGIFEKKAKDEKFILSSGHAGLALYVVLEKHGYGDAEDMLERCGIHPDRIHPAIDCSTGSLGQGLPIALGMALADRNKQVHVLISDGESFEGTTWEVANAMHRFNVKNLNVHINFNGYSAYETVGTNQMDRIRIIFPDVTIHHTYVEDHGLNGLSAHYIKTNQIK